MAMATQCGKLACKITIKQLPNFTIRPPTSPISNKYWLWLSTCFILQLYKESIAQCNCVTVSCQTPDFLTETSPDKIAQNKTSYKTGFKMNTTVPIIPVNYSSLTYLPENNKYSLIPNSANLLTTLRQLFLGCVLCCIRHQLPAKLAPC